MNSLGLKPWILKPRKFIFYMREQIEIPLLRELGMMPALHQHLRAAERDGLRDFLVHLVEGDDVGIVILLRAVKRAEFAINIANIGVIDIAVHVVGDDLIAAIIISRGLRELAATVGERAEFLQRQNIKPQRFRLGNAFAIPDFLQQLIK